MGFDQISTAYFPCGYPHSGTLHFDSSSRALPGSSRARSSHSVLNSRGTLGTYLCCSSIIADILVSERKKNTVSDSSPAEKPRFGKQDFAILIVSQTMPIFCFDKTCCILSNRLGFRPMNRGEPNQVIDRSISRSAAPAMHRPTGTYRRWLQLTTLPNFRRNSLIVTRLGRPQRQRRRRPRHRWRLGSNFKAILCGRLPFRGLHQVRLWRRS